MHGTHTSSSNQKQRTSSLPRFFPGASRPCLATDSRGAPQAKLGLVAPLLKTHPVRLHDRLPGRKHLASPPVVARRTALIHHPCPPSRSQRLVDSRPAFITRYYSLVPVAYSPTATFQPRCCVGQPPVPVSEPEPGLWQYMT
ncbi:hypothetical protein RJ55_07864 [Drechmeria coniospora]|nr:hypothetical protein RJ55_07864 [Drechmeria coniospora]